MKLLKTELPWVFTLLAVTILVWCWNHDRISVTNWAVPTDYGPDFHGGDSLTVLAWIKVASEWEHLPLCSKLVSRLGAPYVANWNDFPMVEEFLIFGLGVCARVFGLMAAANLAMLLKHLTAALAFYACCRYFRFRRVWAWVGALLFGFIYFNSWRGLGHLFVAYTYQIPPTLLCVWLVGGSRRLKWGGKLFWFFVLWAVWMGFSNPYNLNLYGQLMCLALLAQWVARRRKVNLQLGLLGIGLAGLAFVASNLDTFSYRWAHGVNPRSLERGYYQTELFALKPIELVVPPPGHRVESLSQVGSHYFGVAWLKGEAFSPYLGLVSIAALAWLLYESFYRLAQRQRHGRFPAYAPMLAWVVLYATVGGLNNLFALGGMAMFRGGNRYSAFISAIVLFFLVSRLSRLSRRWPMGRTMAVAAILVCIGLADQLPPTTSPTETARLARAVATDRDFATRVEAELPASSMVFQLPVMGFPEADAVQNVQAYDLFRPFLFTKTLRFSFGSNKGRPREDWQTAVSKLPPADMAAQLEAYGFAGVMINRKGFGDRAGAIVQALAASGRNQVVEDGAGDQVFIRLKPAATPGLPPGSHRTPISFGRGWWNLMGASTGDQQWTTGNASLAFHNPHGTPADFMLTAQLASFEARPLVIQLNGKEVWRGNLPPGQGVPLNLTLNARPGQNRVRFLTPDVPKPSREDPVPRAFALIKLELNSALPNPP